MLKRIWKKKKVENMKHKVAALKQLQNMLKTLCVNFYN